MFIFYFCLKQQDKHCIRHYDCDYDCDYDKKIRYKYGPLVVLLKKIYLYLEYITLIVEWEKKVTTSHVTMTLPFITLHFQQRFWKSLRSQSPWLRHNYYAVISIIPKKPNYLLWVWPYLTHIIWQFFDSVHYFAFSANLRVHHQKVSPLTTQLLCYCHSKET